MEKLLRAAYTPDHGGAFTALDAQGGTVTVAAGSHRRVEWTCPRGHVWTARADAVSRGTGCPFCAGKRALPGRTDLATTHPWLLAEWDAAKNELPPTGVSAGSHKPIWWRCARGHSWQAAPYSRAKGAGCPYCTNRRILVGFNDLAATHPGLAKEWDTARNLPLTPEEVTFGSNRRVWWRCPRGHVWRAAVFSRTRKKAAGCPVCNGRFRPPNVRRFQ